MHGLQGGRGASHQGQVTRNTLYSVDFARQLKTDLNTSPQFGLAKYFQQAMALRAETEKYMENMGLSSKTSRLNKGTQLN